MQNSTEPSHHSAHQLQVANYLVDRSLNQIAKDQQIQILEPKAIELLYFLASHVNQVKSREEIRAGVWGNIQVSDHAINRLISQLRKAMNDVSQPYGIIETVAKRGYRLIAEVKQRQMPRATATPKQSSLPTTRNSRYLLFFNMFILSILFFVLWPDNNKALPFMPSGAVKSISAMPAAEWSPKYAVNDQWISYLHQDTGSGEFQLFMQQSAGSQPYKAFTSQSAITSYSWLGESNQLVIAEFASEQCLLKKFQFDTIARRLLDSTTIHDCGTKPVRQLTYSQFNQSLYWLDQNTSSLNGSSRLHILSLAKDKPDVRTSALPRLDNVYALTASPDGRQLALLSHFQWEYSDVYLYDITERKLQNLLSAQPIIHSLSWARQGSQLLYASNNRFNLLQLDGTILPLGFSSENQIKEAHFSANNEQLLYVSDKGRYQLQSFSLQSPTDLAPVSWGSSQNERNPAFSNDGKQLAYISNRNGQYQIWVNNSKGDNVPLHTDQLPLDQTLIRWSADDQYLLFHSDNALYRYDLTQHSYKKLTPDNIYADLVAWSYRHPKNLYLRTDKDGQFNIWQLNSETLAMTKLTKNGGFSGHESRNGRYFYYTRQHQNGLWRIDLSSNQELLIQADFDKENHLSWWLFDDGIYYLNGKQGLGLYWWSFEHNEHQLLWQMPAKHHGGFAVSRELNTVMFALKPLRQWDIMQLTGTPQPL